MNGNEAIKPAIKLLDFDWQLRYVMGSSTLRSREDSLTEVTYHLQNLSSSNEHNVTVEFSKNELKNLIDTLKRASEQA